MKDYRVIVKVQNNPLYQAMQNAGIPTGAQLARAANIKQTEVSKYLNLQKTPFMKNGNYFPSIIKISEALNTMITDLFPEEHLTEPLSKNTSVVDVNKTQLLSITGGTDPMTLLEAEASTEAVHNVLDTMTPREQDIIKRRFGIECDQQTLEEVGAIYGLSRERVRAIEANALRRMRNPMRSDVLKLKNNSAKFLKESINENTK